MRWLLLFLLASCGSQQPRTPDAPPVACASSIVVTSTQTLIVTADTEQVVGGQLPKLACARGSVVRIYGDGAAITHEVEMQGLRARVSRLAPQPVIHTSLATLGDLARLVPADFSFETQSIIVTSVLVGQDIACHDRYMGPSRMQSRPSEETRPRFDQTPRWGQAVIRRDGPYVVVETRGEHSALMAGRCGSGTGCSCIPVDATRLIAVPRTLRPMTFNAPHEDPLER